MPLLNVQVQGVALQQSGGTQIALPPSVGLRLHGPRVQVTIGLAQTMAAQILQSGQAVPTPVTGEALIDTGASSTCIDDAVAQKMGLPVINKVPMTSASHTNTLQNVYPAHLNIAGMINVDVPGAIGANLQAQGLVALIGRDVLQHCLLVYNGATGGFTLSI